MSETTKCHINKAVTIDAHVVAEFPVSWWEYSTFKEGKRLSGSPEDYGKCLEAKCKEFEDFLRDHRSMDMISLFVERTKEDICSVCGSKWEPDEEDGVIFCVGCGAILEIDQPLELEQSHE